MYFRVATTFMLGYQAGMKVFLFMLVAAATLHAEEKVEKTQPSKNPEYKAEKLILGDKTYDEVTVRLANAAEAVISHASGSKRVSATDLPPEVLESIGFYPEDQDVLRGKFSLAVNCLGAKAQDGKFRWFFSVRNPHQEPYFGGFKITLLNRTEPIESGEEIFIPRNGKSTPGGASFIVSFLAFNGPLSEHGDYSVAKFRAEPTDLEGKVTKGSVTQQVPENLLEH